ncbi:MAG: hypothetical protein ABDH91_08995 [Bacteroidia bacterium]
MLKPAQTLVLSGETTRALVSAIEQLYGIRVPTDAVLPAREPE